MTRYAASDFHGHYNLYKEIKKKMKPNDILYVLGDCADRGPNGWKTLKAVLEDPQCILIMGNHELMLIDVIKAWFAIIEKDGRSQEKKADEDITWTYEYKLLSMNGGASTFWELRNEKDLRYWYSRLYNLPYKITILDTKKPIYLTHAGYTLKNEPNDKRTLVWNREHFYGKWPDNNSGIMIHGHTPQSHLLKELLNINEFYFGSEIIEKYNEEDFKVLGYGRNNKKIYEMIYCNGHKIDIDPCTILSKRGILINLETLKQEMVTFISEEECYKY